MARCRQPFCNKPWRLAAKGWQRSCRASQRFSHPEGAPTGVLIAGTVSMTELASYAVTESNSRGRRITEAAPQGRSEFQRDRDRIIHSGAFRRLEYKTQVFVDDEGELFRTRLTHSIDVAQIARSIARRLRLNEDLAEAISLAHDLGHTRSEEH